MSSDDIILMINAMIIAIIATGACMYTSNINYGYQLLNTEVMMRALIHYYFRQGYAHH